VAPTIVDSVPASLIHREIAGLGLTHVLSVPDTHQKTLLTLLEQDESFQLLTFSTEDEAICVNAGLWIGGAEPLVVIQNVGLFAAMNALRGVALDMKVPTCMLVGQYGRDISRSVEDNTASAVRLIEPVLDTLSVSHFRIDHAEDVSVLPRAFAQSRRDRSPVVVLIGAPTA